MYALTPASPWYDFQMPGLGITAGAVSAVGSGASNIAGGALSNLPTSTKIEGGIASALFTAAAVTPPPANVALAIAGAVASLLAAFGVGSGCGETCVLSTQYANKAEEALRANITHYFSSGRTKADQAFGLQAFDTIWNDLYQQCSNPQLGNAGKRCIDDRKGGSCKWKQTEDSVLLGIPGEPQPGECWNWFNGYRAPIAKDAAVAAPTLLTSAEGSVGTALQSLGVSPALSVPLLLGLIGLIAVAVVAS